MSRESADLSSLRDIADRLTFDEIDSLIEGLSAGNLSSFLNNEKLNEALEQDSYIIQNVATQSGITKSCEHGAKLSSIIKHKALKLNEATALELLDLVVHVLLDNFHAPEDEGESSSQGDPERALDFARLSRHFPSGVLAFSALSWDNLPLSGLIAHETASQQRQKRSVAPSNPVSYKELDALVDYEQELETKQRVERIKGLLERSSARGPVGFWEFVLDSDPETGFNSTCLNLYSLTFLTTTGEVSIFAGPDGEPRIKVAAAHPQARKRGGDTVNFQSIVTGWTYARWSQLVEKYSQ